MSQPAPATDDQPTGQKYPASVGVFCDHCHTAVEHDYIVSDTMTQPERFEVAREHLRTNEGWSCTPEADLCPPCRAAGRAPRLPARINTPDMVTVGADGHKSTSFTLKRACNGCGTLLGDVDNRDVDPGGNLTDVRAECPACQPLVALEAAGCRTWHLTRRSLPAIDDAVDRDGVYAKGYWQDVDGKLSVTGLRIGTGEQRIVAYFGDWVVRHPDGRWAVHKSPNEATETQELEGLSGPCDCGEGAVHYTAADCPAVRRQAEGTQR